MLEPTEADEAESRKVEDRKKRVWETAVRQIYHSDIYV